MKIKFITLIKLHLIFTRLLHSFNPRIITIYINIENKGKKLMSVFPKNMQKIIKGIPNILINTLEFLDFLFIKII